MKYGTQTRLKYLYPYVIKTDVPESSLSHTAQMRLKWMRYIDSGKSIPQAARYFDRPERTIRYWRARYNPRFIRSLENQSRRPHNVRVSPIKPSVIQQIVALRRRYPSLGKTKLQVLLRKRGIHVGQSRIQRVVNRSGLKRRTIKKKRRTTKRQHMYTVPADVKNKIGGLVYFDVKHLTLTGGNRVYQFTAIDHATRMLVAKVYSRINSRSSVHFFKYVRRRLGVSKICYFGSDNGSEFLGLLTKELSEQGTIHVFSSPHSPKQNPYVERVIKTVIEECYLYTGIGYSIHNHQQQLDAYVNFYNRIRPHASLELDTPVERRAKIINSLAM